MDDTATSPARALNIAVLGKPNTGKSTLFTALSGIRVHTGNYPGVTVERKIGRLTHAGHLIHLIDAPGTYSLTPRSADEQVTVTLLEKGDVKLGPVDAVLCVVDATQLERGLFLISQLLQTGQRLVVALNMYDVVRKRGIEIDIEALSQKLGGIPIIPTVAHKREGSKELLAAITTICEEASADPASNKATQPTLPPDLPEEVSDRYRWAEQIVSETVKQTTPASNWTDRIDKVLTHWATGLPIFAAVMILVFWALFRGVEPFTGALETVQGAISDWIMSIVPPGALQSLLVDGVVAGVGGVLVFVPQIAILFIFIAILEDTGYMARAALATDKVMSLFGLSGKSFLPLLSSFACAVPGIMATRVIESRRDRMITTLVAPLMSCSARLPVYVLLIETFVPDHGYLGGWVPLKGLVFLGMLILGAVVAIPVAWILGKTLFKGQPSSFLLELPDYKRPSLRTVFWKTYDQTKAFVVRAGTLIFATTIVIWAAAYYPGDHSEQLRLQREINAREASLETEPTVAEAAELDALQAKLNIQKQHLVETSFLGQAGHFIEPVVRPCGWDWRIGTAVVASFPAREVVIATLGTIFSLGEDVDENDPTLRSTLATARRKDGTPLFNVPVALSVMVFFALCAQCVSTLIIIRRETLSWGWPTFCFVYMTLLAYVAAIVTYQVGIHIG